MTIADPDPDDVLLSGRLPARRFEPDRTLRIHDWRFWSCRITRWLLGVLISLAVISLAIEYGFYAPPAAFLTRGLLHSLHQPIPD